MNSHPVFMFGNQIGPEHNWFAWYPVRLWYGRWVWLRTVRRRRLVKKPWLSGPDWETWTYDDIRREPQ